ncbi:mitochondrial carrier domain-containing protein [Syncephalis fuscata]|nr:mitochondrial carrier domain-containing protein [Syncephalis fuscata]
MHSIDTVKTRIQGQPYPQKYTGFIPAYRTVFAEEGFRRGLYGGWIPAMIGSLSGTMIYFGFYEWTKRNLIEQGSPDSIAHLAAGGFGDFMASFIFVPSEVLKTRMQLQGKYNNPHFVSGYNYHNFFHALRTIISVEGPMTLYHGYKATLLRDAPFSALQFAFYERLKVMAMDWHATSLSKATEIIDTGLPASTELIVGAVAGGAAGGLTTPLGK